MSFPVASAPPEPNEHLYPDASGLVNLGSTARIVSQTVRHDRTPFSPPGSSSWFTHGTGRPLPVPFTLAMTVTGPDESGAIDNVRHVIASARATVALAMLDPDAALVGTLVIGTTPLMETFRLPVIGLLDARYASASGLTTVWRLELEFQPARAFWTDAVGRGEHLVA